MTWIGIGKTMWRRGGGVNWSSYWTPLLTELSDGNTKALFDFRQSDYMNKDGDGYISEWYDYLNSSVSNEMVTQNNWYSSEYWDTFTGNWSTSGTTLVSNGSNGSNIKQNFWSSGKTYRIEISITKSAGTLRIGDGFTYVSVAATGSYIKYFTTASAKLYFTSNLFAGTVTAFSIKEIQGITLYQTTTTSTKKPQLTTDGIVFDGIDDFLDTFAFTYAQPCTIYIVFKANSWTNNDFIFDGAAASKGALVQLTPDQNYGLIATSTSTERVKAINDRFICAKILFNGENSSIKIDNGSEYTCGIGNDDLNGFILGGNRTGTTFSDITVRGIIIRDGNDSSLKANSIYTNAYGYFIGHARYLREIMIGFVADDTAIEQYSVLFPLLETYGFKGTYAITNTWIDAVNPYSAGILTTAQLLEIQSAGHEISSHGNTHANFQTLDEADARAEYVASLADFTSKGINVNNFTYPGGTFNEANARAALDYFNSAIDNGSEVQELPAPLSHILRANIDNATLEQMQAFVDEVIMDNGYSFLLLMGHPYLWDSAAISNITDLFAYIQSKGLMIKPLNYIINKIKSYRPVEYQDY